MPPRDVTAKPASCQRLIVFFMAHLEYCFKKVYSKGTINIPRGRGNGADGCNYEHSIWSECNNVSIRRVRPPNSKQYLNLRPLPPDRFLYFSSAKQCFLVLFCQPNRTFSCSRVLLFPCSPLLEVVKHVVKKLCPVHPFLEMRRAHFFICRAPNFGAQKPTKKSTKKWR